MRFKSKIEILDEDWIEEREELLQFHFDIFKRISPTNSSARHPYLRISNRAPYEARFADYSDFVFETLRCRSMMDLICLQFRPQM